MAVSKHYLLPELTGGTENILTQAGFDMAQVAYFSCRSQSPCIQLKNIKEALTVSAHFKIFLIVFKMLKE
jgi:hypothetical protein